MTNKIPKLTLLIVIALSVVGVVGGVYVSQLPVKPVQKIVEPTPKAGNDCKRGGCSNQLCVETNSPDVVSTCEYMAEYGCYQKAECKRQADGKCGFTETEELANCLNTIAR